jgi:hypothetical protein
MSDAELLRQQLDTSFGDGPGHRPIGDRLDAGRRARRQRRRRALPGSATSNVAAGAIALIAVRPQGPGGGVGPDPEPPSTSASPIPVMMLVAPARFVSSSSKPVLYLYGRMFRSSRDVTVLATYGMIDISTHPRGGAIVRVGKKTSWVALAGNQPRAVAVERDGSYDLEAFRSWAQSEVALLSGQQALAATAPGGYRPPLPEQDSPAEFSQGQLVAKPGNSIVQRARHPLANEVAVRRCDDQAARVRTPSGDWFVLGDDCPDGGALYFEPVGVRADSLTAWLIRVHRVQDTFEY